MLLSALRGYHRSSFQLAVPMPRRYAPIRPTNKRKLLFADKLRLSPSGSLGHKLAAVVTPEVRQMRYFTAVAEHGSFTAAARGSTSPSRR